MHLYTTSLSLTHKFFLFVLIISIISPRFLYLFYLTQLIFPSDEGATKEDTAPVSPPSASAAVENNLQKEAIDETPMVEVLEKAAADAKIKHRKKDTKPAVASHEAHQAISSSSDVSILFTQAS
jgi:hypothetical protein